MGLMLHCRGFKVDRKTLGEVALPPSTRTYFPVGHTRFLDSVVEGVQKQGMAVKEEALAMTKNGDLFFGLLQVDRPDVPAKKDYSYVLGLRNSINKRFPASLVAGESVFVCDNLALSGEVRVDRKNTPNILRDLPGLIHRALGKLAEKWNRQDERIEFYKRRLLEAPEVHDLTVRLLDAGAITPTQFPHVLAEYRKPRHAEFAETPSVWRLYNAATEIGKSNSIFAHAERTPMLRSVCDHYVGLMDDADGPVIDVN